MTSPVLTSRTTAVAFVVGGGAEDNIVRDQRHGGQVKAVPVARDVSQVLPRSRAVVGIEGIVGHAVDDDDRFLVFGVEDDRRSDGQQPGSSLFGILLGNSGVLDVRGPVLASRFQIEAEENRFLAGSRFASIDAGRGDVVNTEKGRVAERVGGAVQGALALPEELAGLAVKAGEGVAHHATEMISRQPDFGPDGVIARGGDFFGDGEDAQLLAVGRRNQVNLLLVNNVQGVGCGDVVSFVGPRVDTAVHVTPLDALGHGHLDLPEEVARVDIHGVHVLAGNQEHSAVGDQRIGSAIVLEVEFGRVETVDVAGEPEQPERCFDQLVAVGEGVAGAGGFVCPIVVTSGRRRAMRTPSRSRPCLSPRQQSPGGSVLCRMIGGRFVRCRNLQSARVRDEPCPEPDAGGMRQTV